MPRTTRRGIPDNLDPLVDTLSNVVGILIVVVALTQLQVGDALDRLVALDAERLPAAQLGSAALEARRSVKEARLQKAEARREAILRRSDGDLTDALAAALRALESVKALPEKKLTTRDASVEALEARLAREEAEVTAQEKQLEIRERYAAAIEVVPKEHVARLPDPIQLTGQEAWILCRYGRCFLADRPALIDTGSKAIGEILEEGGARRIRPDEFESVAHHFRKRDVGVGDFAWRVVTTPEPRARLFWRSKDSGIESTRLAESRELRAWLAARSPERDFIRFQVWNDSFETYLEARRVVEAAGYRAGWQAFERDGELDLYLTFGRPPPREGPVEVD